MNNQIQEFKDILNKDRVIIYDLTQKYMYLNIFLNHINETYRCYVSYTGYGNNILMYDKTIIVRVMVAKYTTDKSILEHLANDEDKPVSNKAKERLKELGYE